MPQLIEPTVLEDHHISVGFVFINGAGFRIGTETPDDGCTRHMSIAAARRLANGLEESAEGAALKPVIEVLRDKADRLEGWLEGREQIPHVLAQLSPEGAA